MTVAIDPRPTKPSPEAVARVSAILNLFGGNAATAKIAGTTRKAPFMWRTRGHIPKWHIDKLKKEAKKLKLKWPE